MKHGKRALLAAAAAVFFAATFWLGTPPPGVWNSPDETANAFWASQVSHGGPLAVHDAIVGLGLGAVHPRSMAVFGDALVPGSFPGLFLLYGAIRSIAAAPLAALTPFFTALAGLALFALLRRLFDERLAFWSALLFYAHPAIIYYAARGLFHNILFVDLLIFAAAVWTVRPFAGKRIFLNDAFGGLAFGWALITRTAEAPWVILGALVFLPLAGKEAWRRLPAVVLGMLFPIFLFMNLNAVLYGSPFRTAYVAPAPPAASAQAPEVPSIAPTAPLLPFGFHPRLVVLHAVEYLVVLFWWFAALAALGLAAFIARWRSATRAWKTYLGVAAGVTAWLVILYGSWLVTDRFDALSTVGVSYARYFLPIDVLLLPFAAAGVLWIADKTRRARWLAPGLCALVAGAGIWAAVWRGDDGLLAVRATLAENAAKKPALLAAIPPDAVVMTERFDKVIVPERLRIIPATDDAAFASAAALSPYAPIYWYGLDLSSADLDALRGRAAAHGFALVETARPVAGEILYRLDPSS